MTALPTPSLPQPASGTRTVGDGTHLRVVEVPDAGAVASDTIAELADLVLSNLDQQLSMHARLLELASAQAGAVAARDAGAVHEILQEVEHVLLDRSRIEMQRGQVLARTAAELGLPADQLTVSVLAGRLDADRAERLTTAASRLREMIAELAPLVQANRAVIEQELEVIDGVVRLAASSGEQQATYARPGTSIPTEGRTLLDMQV